MRPLPFMPFCMYVAEKHTQSVYKEDCLYLIARQSINEKDWHLLKQPYIRSIDNKNGNTEQSKSKTLNETIDCIFDGI